MPTYRIVIPGNAPFSVHEMTLTEAMSECRWADERVGPGHRVVNDETGEMVATSWKVYERGVYPRAAR